MDLLIKAVKIIDKDSPFNLQKKDVLIINGKIDKIEDSIESNGTSILEENDLHLSQGWIDLHSNFQDPGFEQKEDINSGLKAAALGGFTTVLISPLTQPVRDTKAQVEYLVNQGKNNAVQALPYGSISKGNLGKELAELKDMSDSGAVAFFDGKKSVKNPNLLNRALLYTQSFDGLVVNYPHTEEVAYNGMMNEGEISTKLGLSGIPELAEELMVARDLHLLEYSKGKLHLNSISSKKSVELIAKAKKAGLKVSCDISAYNLLLDDSELNSFDSNYKTLPPLRSKATIKALINGIKSGVIDAVSSDHCPEDIDSKRKEFDYASFGIINAQTAFAVTNTALEDKIELTDIINLFTSNPQSILNLNKPKIDIGELANLTLFQPKEKFVFTKALNASKSENSPFFEMELTGKVVGIVNRNKLVKY